MLAVPAAPGPSAANKYQQPKNLAASAAKGAQDTGHVDPSRTSHGRVARPTGVSVTSVSCVALSICAL